MTISNDLFFAILAMDSYNRGYNAGVTVTGNQIGNAILGRATDADLEPEAVAAGFLAQSYTWNGQKIISYRGTDVLPPSGYADIAAWSIWATDNYNSAQARLAAQFYQQISSEITGSGETSIITTS